MEDLDERMPAHSLLPARPTTAPNERVIHIAVRSRIVRRPRAPSFLTAVPGWTSIRHDYPPSPSPV